MILQMAKTIIIILIISFTCAFFPFAFKMISCSLVKILHSVDGEILQLLQTELWIRYEDITLKSRDIRYEMFLLFFQASSKFICDTNS